MPVSFKTEPSIHNLEDAPAPSEELLVAISPPISPRPTREHSSLLRTSRSSPSPPLTVITDGPGESVADTDKLKLADDEMIDEEGSGGCDDEEYDSQSGDLPEQAQRDEIPDDDSSQRAWVHFPFTCLAIPARCRKECSWNRLSVSVVQYAPCFWCMAEGDKTDRNILYRLNILCAFFATGQVVAGALVLFSQIAGGFINKSEATGRTERNYFAPTLWSLDEIVLFCGFVGLITLITTLLTLRVIKEVRVVGSIRYMWALLAIIPAELFLIISLIDIYRVTDVYVKQWWYVNSMAWYRDRLCAKGTGETRCVVPICGLPLFGQAAATNPYMGTDSEECIDGENSWCSFYYNATDCRSIRNDAQAEMRRTSYIFFAANFVWGVILIILLLLTINTLEAIITKPVVQKAKESNVPGWMTLPFVFSTTAGAIMMFSPNSVLNVNSGSDPSWIASCFMGLGGLFLAAGALGWILSTFTITNSLDKRTKQLVAWLFIITLAFTLLAIVVVFSLSIFYSTEAVDVGISVEGRGDIACGIDTVDSCSFCGNTNSSIVECPEWTTNDVTRVIQTQLKQSAILAAILSIFAFGAFRFGLVLRRHIAEYEIDYV